MVGVKGGKSIVTGIKGDENGKGFRFLKVILG
jgi:hypothetical protein